MSLLDDLFAALAQSDRGWFIGLHGVATLTGRIAFTHDGPQGPSSTLHNVIASGVVEPNSVTYSPPLPGAAAAVRFAVPLRYVRPAMISAAESTTVTLTKNEAIVPFYTIDFALPWADVGFVANVDGSSGVIYGSAADQLVALALAIRCEPHPAAGQTVESSQSTERGNVRRLREPRRRQR